MRFSTLAVLFTAVSATYALPLRPKARRDLLAILTPRMDGVEDPTADPHYHYKALDEKLGKLKEKLERTEIKGEASQKIINAYNVASRTKYWQWQHGPEDWQIAAYTKLNEHDKDFVWIIASRGSVPDTKEKLFREESQSILLAQQHGCLNGWTKDTKDTKDVYYIVVKTDKHCVAGPRPYYTYIHRYSQ